MIRSNTCTLLVFNTVERLLRGDFFHTITPDEMDKELSEFSPHWHSVGVGTSNWFKRNGELIVTGSSGAPRYLWADPNSNPNGRIYDLTSDHVADQLGNLITPETNRDDTQPRFPFISVAVCDPAEAIEFEVPAGVYFHAWYEEVMIEANIGLSAMQCDAKLLKAEYTTCCHIPLGGFRENDDVYSNFKNDMRESKIWMMRGLYALNPTIQSMISVKGHPLHLHGLINEEGIGGHLSSALVESSAIVRVWRMKDLVLRIRDIDVAWQPVKYVESS